MAARRPPAAPRWLLRSDEVKGLVLRQKKINTKHFNRSCEVFLFGGFSIFLSAVTLK